VGVLGGDHSSPLGLMRSLAQHYDHYSILHIDAHADLRVAYEGFEFSHASIMHNALHIPQIDRLVQVGIRDTCPAEVAAVNESGDRVVAFYDWAIQEGRFMGKTWHSQCQEMLNLLSDTVYISFDIDGLDPALCPNTGTPVPGGLQFEEAMYLLKLVGRSGKRIIGFDLCEVSPGEDDWDGNVGARVLYRLVSSTLQSHSHYGNSQ
jgi:agmatinase